MSAIVKLGSFEIANGFDRLSQVIESESYQLTQQTGVTANVRAAWPVAFPDRALRSLPLSYHVAFPPCSSMEAAQLEARTIPLLCPKGGVLTEDLDGLLITFPQAWIESIAVERLGVTNVFTFSLHAVNPGYDARVLDIDDVGLDDETDTELTYF